MSKPEDTRTGLAAAPPVRVRVDKGEVKKREFIFTGPFRIGSDDSCEVQVLDSEVSPAHAEVWFMQGKWWVLDLHSANGTYKDGEKIERAVLAEHTRIQLGLNGPILSLIIQRISKPTESEARDPSLTHYMKRYFGDTDDESVGQRTMMIRTAFKKVQTKQKRKFAVVTGVILCLFLAAGSYAVYKHMELSKQRQLAEDIFYAMKSLELEFSAFLKTARVSQDAESVGYVKKYRAKRKEMQASYDKFIDTLEIYGKEISEEERIILRIARTFGECELNIPPGFSKEVLNYVKKWQSTNRLKKAIARAKRYGYIPKIAETMLDHDLPPQFLYLGLQESDFKINACGPKTRWGIAKGMWQFIPDTAIKYGLRTGPLLHVRRPDPRDDRHHFGQSTLAAARYLRDIYDTEAQASGLLVFASYNWGERRIIKLIQKMPENPRERNFWRLLASYKNEIPKETYNYVFSIFSAAVIGENPRLFGFDFDRPLGDFEEKVSSSRRGQGSEITVQVSTTNESRQFL